MVSMERFSCMVRQVQARLIPCLAGKERRLYLTLASNKLSRNNNSKNAGKRMLLNKLPMRTISN